MQIARERSKNKGTVRDVSEKIQLRKLLALFCYVVLKKTHIVQFTQC